MRLSIILDVLNFQSFKALGSTYSHLHQRLPKSFKAAAITSRNVLKLMRGGHLYLGPLQIIERNLELEMILKFPVITCPAVESEYLDSLQSHGSEVFTSCISRSETSLLKLNIVDLIDSEIFIALQLTGLTYHSLLCLLECLVMSLILTF